MAEKPDYITNVGKNKARKRAKKVAEEHSPDLSEAISIKIDDRTTIFISQAKLDKNGKGYYLDKYGKR